MLKILHAICQNVTRSLLIFRAYHQIPSVVVSEMLHDISECYTFVQNVTRDLSKCYTFLDEFFGSRSKYELSIFKMLHAIFQNVTNLKFTFIFPIPISNPCWRKYRLTYSRVSKWNYWSCISIKNLLFRWVWIKIIPKLSKSVPRREK